MTLATRALATEDTLAIQQLYARYNHAIDFGDGAGWAACFTEDGVFTSSMSGTMTGGAALSAFATGFAARLKARHWTNNLVIEADGDGARGKCYLMLIKLNEGAPASVFATAIYMDSLARGEDGWKFTNRTVTGDA